MKTPSQEALAASPEMKLAMTDGAIMIELEKMIGITPAEFTFNGKKLARAIAAEPPLPACWTGILRLLSSMKTTNAVMSTNSKM